MKKLYCILFCLITTIVLLQGQLLAQYGSSTVHENTDPIEFSIYPNPTVEDFSIKTNQEFTKVIVSNILGKTVKEFSASASHSYDVSDLHRGIYVIRILDENSRVILARRIRKS